MDESARQPIEELLRKQQIVIKRDYLDSGRLILAFDDVAAQLKARDTVDATLSDVDRSALSNATRAPAWMRTIGPQGHAAGTGPARRALPALPGRHQRRGHASCSKATSRASGARCTEAKLPFTDITTHQLRRRRSIADGLRVTLPAGTRQPPRCMAALKKVDNTLNFHQLRQRRHRRSTWC